MKRSMKRVKSTGDTPPKNTRRPSRPRGPARVAPAARAGTRDMKSPTSNRRNAKIFSVVSHGAAPRPRPDDAMDDQTPASPQPPRAAAAPNPRRAPPVRGQVRGPRSSCPSCVAVAVKNGIFVNVVVSVTPDTRLSRLTSLLPRRLCARVGESRDQVVTT